MPTDHGQNNETVIFPLPGLIITQPPVRWPRWTFCEPSSNCRGRGMFNIIGQSHQSRVSSDGAGGRQKSSLSVVISHGRRGERHHDPDLQIWRRSLNSVFLFPRTEVCIIRRTWAGSFKYTNRRRFLYRPCVCPAVLAWPTEHKRNPN